MVAKSPLTVDEMLSLSALDTPTVCNALEVVSPPARTEGFSREAIGCVHPGVTRLVGFARTARVRSSGPSGMSASEIRAGRLAYYEYIANGGPLPSVCVVQDIDERVGFGALWGEVNTAIHLGLGCKGVVTNGGVRDLDECAPGFQMLGGRVTPSHAHIHIVDFDVEVTVFGVKIRPGDLIHADKNGVVTFTVDQARKLPEVARVLQRREAVMLAAARAPGFTVEVLGAALASADEIH